MGFPMSVPAEVKPSLDEVLGVSVCTNCQKRFRIHRKHAAMVGKMVKCPSCHQPFPVKLEVPSAVEQAAIQNAQATGETETKTRKNRRSKTEIRQQFIDRIRTGLKSFHGRLSEIVEAGGSEEQIRVWCIDLLKTVLEYEDQHIDTEVSALGQRIDIALKCDNKIFLIIECKNPRMKLTNSVRDQAVMYAVNKSADWTVTTNGHVWKLWHVIPQKGQDPLTIQVFDIALLDDDGVSDRDVENFYLLTKRALFNGETLTEFHRQESINDQRILQILKSERVIAAIKRSAIDNYAAEKNERVALSDETIIARLDDMFLPEEL